MSENPTLSCRSLRGDIQDAAQWGVPGGWVWTPWQDGYASGHTQMSVVPAGERAIICLRGGEDETTTAGEVMARMPALEALVMAEEQAAEAATAAREESARRDHAAFLSRSRSEDWGVLIAGWDGRGIAPACLIPAGQGRWEIPAGTEVRWTEVGSGGSRAYRERTARQGLVCTLRSGRTTSMCHRWRLTLHIPSGYGEM